MFELKNYINIHYLNTLFINTDQEKANLSPIYIKNHP